jgi:hypothetical protein
LLPIGRTDPVSELIVQSHTSGDERDGVTGSAVFVTFARAGDVSSSPVGNGDDDEFTSSCATFVKSDHCAASHFGDGGAGVDGFKVDMVVESRIEVGVVVAIKQSTRSDRSESALYLRRGNGSPR